jgi:tripartite-type tricarboxylate transporter receptor subunit TctC
MVRLRNRHDVRNLLLTPAALSAFMASETTRWQPIAQAAGMKK